MIKTQSSSQTVSNWTRQLISLATVGAQVYITIEHFEKAVEDCDKAIALDPGMTKVSQKQKRYVKNLTKYLGVV